MMKKISTPFLIAFSSCSLVFTVLAVLYACGPDIYDPNPGFFNPSPTIIPKFKPFYRDATYAFWGEPKTDYVHDLDRVNINDWYIFFKKEVHFSDLEDVVYRYSLPEIDSMIFWLRDKNFRTSAKLTSNGILWIADKKKINDFLFYLGFAKRCEPYAINIFEYPEYRDTFWAEARKKIDTLTNTNYLEHLLKGGKQQLKNTSFAFIKERYQFQICRLLFQSGNFQGCIDYYESVKQQLKKGSLTNYRIQGYVAGAHYRLKHYSTANTMYCRLFTACPEMQKACMSSFHPHDDSDFVAVQHSDLGFKEKSAFWFMLGFYDCFRGLTELYKHDPKSEMLDVLLARYIDIFEEEIQQGQKPGYYYRDERNIYEIKDRNKIFSFNIPDSQYNVIKEIADRGNTKNTRLWNLAVGYFAVVKGDFAGAHAYLDLADRGLSEKSSLYVQTSLMRLYLAVEEAESVTPVLMKTVVQKLSWLASHKDMFTYELVTLTDWVKGRLAAKHYVNDQIVLAECLLTGIDSTFFESPRNIEQLLAFMNKPEKTEYENFVMQSYPYGEFDIHDYVGVRLLQSGQPDKALQEFNQASSGFSAFLKKITNKNEYEDYVRIKSEADPFLTSIRERDSAEWKAMQGRELFTKLSFTKKLADLYHELERNGGNKAELYFRIATAYYNITYFGNSRRLYQTNIENSGHYDFLYRTLPFPMKALDCSLAKFYYTKALEEAKNNELRARCTFMLARCEQNEFFVNRPEGYDGDFKAGHYFAVLKKDFSNTAYYQEIIRECGYFRTYLGM